jgi:hypothetical protein
MIRTPRIRNRFWKSFKKKSGLGILLEYFGPGSSHMIMKKYNGRNVGKQCPIQDLQMNMNNSKIVEECNPLLGYSLQQKRKESS